MFRKLKSTETNLKERMKFEQNVGKSGSCIMHIHPVLKIEITQRDLAKPLPEKPIFG